MEVFGWWVALGAQSWSKSVHLMFLYYFHRVVYRHPWDTYDRFVMGKEQSDGSNRNARWWTLGSPRFASDPLESSEASSGGGGGAMLAAGSSWMACSCCL